MQVESTYQKQAKPKKQREKSSKKQAEKLFDAQARQIVETFQKSSMKKTDSKSKEKGEKREKRERKAPRANKKNNAEEQENRMIDEKSKKPKKKDTFRQTQNTSKTKADQGKLKRATKQKETKAKENKGRKRLRKDQKSKKDDSRLKSKKLNTSVPEYLFEKERTQEHQKPQESQIIQVGGDRAANMLTKQKIGQNIELFGNNASQMRIQISQVYRQQDVYQDEDSAQVEMAIKLHAKKDEIEAMAEEQKNKINLSQQELKQQQIDKDLDPTLREVDSIIQQFKQKFPHKDIDKIINQLFICLIRKQPNGKDYFHGHNGKYTQYDKNMKAMGVNGNKSILKRFFPNNESAMNKMTQIQRMKFQQKALVARAFCNRDYGIQGINQEIQESKATISIDRNRYKNLVNSVAVDAYRRLQQFLVQQCDRDIKPLNRDQIRTIESVLLNCRKNFESEQCSTYLKFMKLCFGLGSVTITEQAVIKLYITIQKALRARIGQMQLDKMCDTMRCNKEFKAKRSFQNQRFQIYRIWTAELQIQMLEMYKKLQQYQKLRDYFKQKYPHNQHYFTIQSLKSRFHKAMRVALRKVNCFCQKFGADRVPSLIKMSDNRVKCLLRNLQGINARLLLVQMYLNDECDIKRLYQTVSAINQFVIMKDNQKMNQMIEAQPMINNATEKIYHNVSISRVKVTQENVKKQFVWKGQDPHFDHIVQNTNGNSLHYFRKVSGVGIEERYQIKREAEDEEFKKNVIQSKAESSYSEFEQSRTVKSSQHSVIPKGGKMYINPIVNQNRQDNEDNAFQFLIKETVQKHYSESRVSSENRSLS